MRWYLETMREQGMMAGAREEGYELAKEEDKEELASLRAEVAALKAQLAQKQ
jgi:hypothetical protein